MSVKEVKKKAKEETVKGEGDSEAKAKQDSSTNKSFTAELKWTEPFFTKAEQNIESGNCDSFRCHFKKELLSRWRFASGSKE